jgi:hypothetical protein
MSDEERAEVEKAAKRLSLSVAAFIRMSALKAARENA